jgi:hypothetical protein
MSENAPNNRSGPTTPQKNQAGYVDFSQVLLQLNAAYNLGIGPGVENESPSKRRARAEQNEQSGKEHSLRERLRYHFHKRSLPQIVKAFNSVAVNKCRRWVDKPDGDQDTLPAIRSAPKASSRKEQVELQDALHRLLDAYNPAAEPAPRATDASLTRSKSDTAAVKPPPPPDARLPLAKSQSGRILKRRSGDGPQDDSPKRMKMRPLFEDIASPSATNSNRVSARALSDKTVVAAPAKDSATSPPDPQPLTLTQMGFASRSANSSRTSLGNNFFSTQEDPPSNSQSTVDYDTSYVKKDEFVPSMGRRRSSRVSSRAPSRAPSRAQSRLSMDAFAPSSGEELALQESFAYHEAVGNEKQNTSSTKEAAKAVSVSEVVAPVPDEVYLSQLRQTWRM